MSSSKDLFIEDGMSESGEAPGSDKTEISKISVFTPSRVDLRNFQESIRLSVLSGELNPLEVMAKAKLAQKYIESIVGGTDKEKGIPEVKEGARVEAEKYGTKAFPYNGLSVELTENGAKWDFKATGDPVWNDLQEKMESLKTKIKEREDFLKAMKSPIEVTDESTGEVVKVQKPVYKSTSGLRFTLL